jgi:hypothetical protein
MYMTSLISRFWPPPYLRLQDHVVSQDLLKNSGYGPACYTTNPWFIRDSSYTVSLNRIKYLINNDIINYSYNFITLVVMITMKIDDWQNYCGRENVIQVFLNNSYHTENNIK